MLAKAVCNMDFRIAIHLLNNNIHIIWHFSKAIIKA